MVSGLIFFKTLHGSKEFTKRTKILNRNNMFDLRKFHNILASGSSARNNMENRCESCQPSK